MNNDDMPKKWTEMVGEDVDPNTLPTEYEEQAPALSYEEQKELVEQEAPEEYKDMFGALVEVSNMANLLAKIDTDESQYVRRKMLDIVSEEFIRKRMNTNVKLEDIKLQLINRVANNIDQLDLTTSYEMAKGIHEMTQGEAQSPIGRYANPSIMPQPNQNGTTVNIVTGSEGQINTQEIKVNNTQIPNGGANMKSISQMSEAVKSFQSTIKRKPEPVTINTEGQESK